MRIDVSFRGLEPSAALREHAVRRLEAQLAGCADAVTSVHVRFIARRDAASDADRHCQVTITFTPGNGSATVEALHPDPHIALERAAGRVGGGARTHRRASGRPTRDSWIAA